MQLAVLVSVMTLYAVILEEHHIDAIGIAVSIALAIIAGACPLLEQFLLLLDDILEPSLDHVLIVGPDNIIGHTPCFVLKEALQIDAVGLFNLALLIVVVEPEIRN